MTIRMNGCVVLCGVLAMAGCTLHLDRSTTLKSGVAHGSVYTVDGDVRVDPSAHARKISVVDGDIVLGKSAHASGLRSVDGRIELDDDVTCSGDVKSVAGKISLAHGVRIKGNVSTLSGTVNAHGAFISGRLETVAGRIRLTGATHIVKGIVLPKPDPSVTVNNHEERRLPVLVIGPGVVVDGPIVAARGGVLKVSRQAKIGAVSGISVQWFDGPAPALKDVVQHEHGDQALHQRTTISR